MNSKEQLLGVLSCPHVSEKSSSLLEKYNVVVFNVNKRSSKSNIKYAVEQLFSVNVYHVRTLNVKGKIIKKRGQGIIGKRDDWKKAYVTLASGQKIDFFDRMQQDEIKS